MATVQELTAASERLKRLIDEMNDVGSVPKFRRFNEFDADEHMTIASALSDALQMTEKRRRHMIDMDCRAGGLV